MRTIFSRAVEGGLGRSVAVEGSRVPSIAVDCSRGQSRAVGRGQSIAVGGLRVLPILLLLAAAAATANAENATSGRFRLETRESFGGRLAWGVTPVAATADGVTTGSVTVAGGGTAAPLWNTAARPDGWHELTLAGVTNGATARIATLNGPGVRVREGTLTNNVTWVSNEVQVVRHWVVVPAGRTLTLAGSVVKFCDGTGIQVDTGGTLNAVGAVLTHVADDTAGGDTNMDGTQTAPQADRWRISGAGQINMDAGTEERWGPPAVTSGTISGAQTWRGGRVYHVSGDVTVASGATLTIQPGAIVKFAAGRSLIVSSGGSLSAVGNRAQPIIFTSVKDDSVGGDTNGDGGATTPQAGDWVKLGVNGGVARLEYVSILYSSKNSTTGAINMNGGRVTFVNGIIAHGLYDAVGVESGNFHMTNSVIHDCLLAFRHWPRDPIVNCVVYDCGRITQGGGQNFVNCAFVNIAEVYEAFGWSSTYKYCSFYNPPGYGPQSAQPVGSNGNIWGDPRFADAAAGDYRLQVNSPCIDAADGTVAPVTDYYGQPRVDLKATKTGVPSANGAYPDIGISERMSAFVPSDVDLAALTVTATNAATVGGTITVRWTVKNVGKVSAQGTWRDTVYFMSDIGQQVEAKDVIASGPVNPDETKQFSGTVVVPALSEGSWRVAVRVNSYRDLFEGALVTNNSAQAAVPTRISIPTVNVTSATNLTLSAGQSTAFRLTGLTGTGGVVLLRIPGDVAIYGASGRTPTGDSHDWEAIQVSPGVWMLVIPAGVDPSTVCLTVDNSSGTAQSAALQYAAGSFYLYDAGKHVVAISGSQTFTVSGAGFTADMEVWLSNGSTTIQAKTITVESANSLTAVFDLTGKPNGDYRLYVKRGATTLSYLAAQLTASVTGAKWTARLDIPSSIRQGRTFTAFFEYGNTGDVELPAPYVKLTAASGVNIRFASEDPWQTELELMAVSDTYPVSVLKPGEIRRIPVEFILTSGGSGSVQIMTFEHMLANSTAFPWDNNAPYMRPSWASDQAWVLIYSTLKANVGLTWDAYLNTMRSNLDHLALQGKKTYRLGGIWRSEVNNALGVDYAVSTLAGGTDLYRAGRGFNLALSRSYGSGLYQRLRTGGEFGDGWTGNNKVTLELVDNGNSLYFNLPSGSVYSFSKLNGKWVSDSSADKTVLTETASDYTLTYQSGTVQTFSKSLRRISTMRDIDGNSLTYGYDPATTNLATLTHSDGQWLRFTYTGHLLTQASDDQGRTVIYDYTGSQLTLVTRFDGLQVRYNYYAADSTAKSKALRQTVYPDGTTADLAYDASGRVATLARNGTREPVEIVRGRMGSYSIISANGAVSTVNVGTAGEALSVVNPLNDQIQLDYKPDTTLLESMTSPTGKRVQIGYDSDYQTVRTVDAAGFETSFGYTPDFGNLETVTDARGRTLTYQYDSKGRSQGILYPDGKKEGLEYTPTKGDIKTVSNRRGQSISYVYDAEGRVTDKRWPDGRAFVWRYDAKGNPTNILDTVTGAIAISYDAQERVTQITYPGNRGFTYAYDAAGRVAERTAHDGHKLKYSYDTLGRLAAMRDKDNGLYVTNVYDAAMGYVTRETYGNGASAAYLYDAMGRVTNITHKASNGTVMDAFAYTHDADGRRVALKSSAGENRYGYDLTGQLTSVGYADGGTETFTYDAVGNRVTTVKGAVTTAYTVNDMNQYMQAGAATFTYDDDGNLTSKTDGGQITRYGYDVENRLISVTRPDGKVWSCQYDALGNRVSVTDDGVTRRFVFIQSSLPSVAAEYTDTGTLVKRYIHVGALLIADETTAADRRYYHADGLASTRILTGTAGTSVGRLDYDVYGAVRFATGVTTSFGYVGIVGVEKDATGLLFMRNRYYGTDFGRFLQADPIGLGADDVNQYRYCANSPFGWIDPTGLAKESLCVKLSVDLNENRFYPETKKKYSIDKCDEFTMWKENDPDLAGSTIAFWPFNLLNIVSVKDPNDMATKLHEATHNFISKEYPELNNTRRGEILSEKAANPSMPLSDVIKWADENYPHLPW